MPLETATYISDLNASNPIGATDPLSSADDHLRLLKATIKASFPGVTGAVNSTQGQLNLLNSLTALSVLANATNAGAAPAALQAGADGQVLARIGAALVFSGDYPRLSTNNVFLNGVNLSSTNPSFILNDSDGAADQKNVWLNMNAAAFQLFFVNDANNVFVAPLSITRAGTVASAMALAATAITLNGVNITDYARLSQGGTFAQQLRVQGGVATSLNIDKTGSTVNRFRLFVGDGTGGTVADENYISSSNTDLHFWAGAAGTTETLKITVAGNFDFKGGTVTTNNASASEVGYKGLPQNSQAVSYTTVLADCDKNLHQTGATKTFTIDSNANVAAPIGTTLVFTCDNATGVSIAITADTLRLAGTATTGTRTLAQYGIATAIKILATTWLISGTGLS